MTEDPQKQLREEDGATPPLPPLSLPADTGGHSPLAKDEDEPHPLLIALVQAMARNAARKDYAASQRGDDD